MPHVERIPGKVSGQWIVKDTRILADGVIENWAEGLSAEEIAEEVYSGLGVDVRAVSSSTQGSMPPIRILLDQNAPLGLRRALRQYEVTHADELGWGRLRNGDLIRAAEEAGFVIMITCDRNVRYQQNLEGRRIILIELSGGGWPTIRNHVDRLLTAIADAQPGTYIVIPMPRPILRRRPHPRPES